MRARRRAQRQAEPAALEIDAALVARRPSPARPAPGRRARARASARRAARSAPARARLRRSRRPARRRGRARCRARARRRSAPRRARAPPRGARRPARASAPPVGCPVSGGTPPSASPSIAAARCSEAGVLLGARAGDEQRRGARGWPTGSTSVVGSRRARRSTISRWPRCAHRASPPSRCTHTATGTASRRCRSAHVMSHNSAGVRCRASAAASASSRLSDDAPAGCTVPV